MCVLLLASMIDLISFGQMLVLAQSPWRMKQQKVDSFYHYVINVLFVFFYSFLKVSNVKKYWFSVQITFNETIQQPNLKC
jgi:hypothetical protein